VLTTGKPEALRIMVGSTQAPAVGAPGKTVTGVSLKAADLMRAPGAQPAAAVPVQKPQPTTGNSSRASRPARRQPQSSAPSAPSTGPSTPDVTQSNGAAPATTN
jgi:hypothetical protein